MSDNTVNLPNIQALLNNQVKKAETFLKLNKYDEAKKTFIEMTEDFPYDYRGYWGVIRANTQEFSIIGLEFLEESKAMFMQATTVASIQEKNEFLPVYEKYKKIAEQTEKEMREKLDIVSRKEEKITEDLTDISNKIDEKQALYEKKIRTAKLRFRIILFPIIYYAVVKLWSEMEMFPLILAMFIGLIPAFFLAKFFTLFMSIFLGRKYKKKLKLLVYEVEEIKEEFSHKFDEVNAEAEEIKEEFYAM